MSSNTKQEELKEMANHIVGNCMGSHSCFYMNLPTELSDSEIDEAISNEIVSRIKSEVTAVLEELENNQAVYAQWGVGDTTEIGNAVPTYKISALKQRYGGK